MIRINLLGAAKPKKGKKPVIQASGGVSVVFAGTIIMVGLAGGLNVYEHWTLNKQQERIAADLRKAEIENRRLSDVKASYVERDKVKDNYKRRVDVIDQLRTAQAGPVNLLNKIGETVNSTEEVWLTMMTDNGPSIELKGTALSVNGVADLVGKLKSSGYFSNVEIKETYQDSTVKEMQAFVFTMTCDKPAQSQAAPAPDASKSDKKKS